MGPVPAIFVTLLIVLRSLLGLAGGDAVWCESGHHQHDSQCSHAHDDDCESGFASLLPMPADFHDADCECSVDRELAGDVFTLQNRSTDIDACTGAAGCVWEGALAWDVRTPSFRGPPRAETAVDYAGLGRLAVVASTRLTI